MKIFEPEKIIYRATLEGGIQKHTIVSVATLKTGCSTTYDYRLKGFAGTQYSGIDFYETAEEAKSALLQQAHEIYEDQVDKIKKMEVIEYP